MRQPGVACQQCRNGKRKCDRPKGVVCKSCVKRRLQCSSDRSARSNAVLQPIDPRFTDPRPESACPDAALSSAQKIGLESLSTAQIQELVDHYVDYVHDKPHSLFHAPTLRLSVADGSIDKAMLCAIIALSARFSSDGAVRGLGAVLGDQSKEMMQSRLETLSLDSVRTWILLGNACGADFKYASESLFFGIAIRSAHILRLAEPLEGETAVMAETRSRVWWTLYMLDRWSAAGLGTPRQMSDKQPSLRIPRMEYVFHNLLPEQREWPEDEPRPGLWAHMLSLVEIFGPIQDLNRLIAFGSVDESFVASTVSSLGSRLDEWQHQLPDGDRLTINSMAMHQARGQGRTFVALHLGYYHYATLLYFQYLDQAAATLPYATVYAERCREHASAFSDLLRTSYEMDTCAAMYNIVGHMTVISSSVLIHTLLLGNEDQVKPAKARLESNFKILMRLKAWWPSVDSMTQRLFRFQDACLRNADNRTHKMDRWMVRFLLEHGNPLAEKTEDALIGVSSIQNLHADSADAQRMLERDQIMKHALSGLKAS